MKPVSVIDSHTEGEPTRVVVDGGPVLLESSLAKRVAELSALHDSFRSAVVCEPRGSDAVVGALLTEPTDARAAAGVIFFNNVGYLGMCGHGTIGVVRTLRDLGKITHGQATIETPVGVVQTFLHEDGRVTVENVPSFRSQPGVEVSAPGFGTVIGDVAYGGNWFFLTEAQGLSLELANVSELTRFATAVRAGLDRAGITGSGGAEIDHIELFGPARSERANSRNFVLCPGLAYDRSPCGTGTSAKLACLAASGRLAPGDLWVQESVIGSRFEATFQWGPNGQIVPSITGRAFVTSRATLQFEALDPFAAGILP